MSRPSLTARLTQAAHPTPARVVAHDEKNEVVAEPVKRKQSNRRLAANGLPQTPLASAGGSVPARAGKTMIAGYFSGEFARAVRVLAAERGVTIQALIGEGLDVVLRQAGKHPMGER